MLYYKCSFPESNGAVRLFRPVQMRPRLPNEQNQKQSPGEIRTRVYGVAIRRMKATLPQDYIEHKQGAPTENRTQVIRISGGSIRGGV